VNNVSVVVGRNSNNPFGNPVLTVPCTRVKPDAIALVFKMELGIVVSAKPAPNATTAISKRTIANLYPV
jgi:hypothetical protein